MSKVLKITKPIILDRPLNKSKNENVSLSAMAFLFRYIKYILNKTFSEMLQYTQKRVSGIEELEKRLFLDDIYSFLD